MKCENCIASKHENDDYWCGVGEIEQEFSDGSYGCRRRNIGKLERDLQFEINKEIKGFAESCKGFVNFYKKGKLK
jgi:hypothetical protein